MLNSQLCDAAATQFDVRTHALHWLADLSVALLACTCVPALALGPTTRDLEPGFGGILATAWFLFRLTFVGLSPPRVAWQAQNA